MVLLGVRNRIQTGERLEILLPDNIMSLTVKDMMDKNGNKLSEAHSGSEIYLPLEREIPLGVFARQPVNLKKDSI